MSVGALVFRQPLESGLHGRLGLRAAAAALGQSGMVRGHPKPIDLRQRVGRARRPAANRRRPSSRKRRAVAGRPCRVVARSQSSRHRRPPVRRWHGVRSDRFLGQTGRFRRIARSGGAARTARSACPARPWRPACGRRIGRGMVSAGGEAGRPAARPAGNRPAAAGTPFRRHAAFPLCPPDHRRWRRVRRGLPHRQSGCSDRCAGTMATIRTVVA